MSQIRRMREEFDVGIEWRGYELYPEPMPLNDFTPGSPPDGDRPRKPTRLELAYAAEDLDYPPFPHDGNLRTRLAHCAVEAAKEVGRADAVVVALYDALWMRGEPIGEPEVVQRVVEPILGTAFDPIQALAYAERIVLFDEPAYASGVWNVPTFWIGGRRYAEQPYRVLRRALREVVG